MESDDKAARILKDEGALSASRPGRFNPGVHWTM